MSRATPLLPLNVFMAWTGAILTVALLLLLLLLLLLPNFNVMFCCCQIH